MGENLDGVRLFGEDGEQMTRDQFLSGATVSGVRGVSGVVELPQSDPVTPFYERPINIGGARQMGVVLDMFSREEGGDPLAFVPEKERGAVAKWVENRASIDGVSFEDARKRLAMAAYYNSFGEGKGMPLSFCYENADLFAQRAGDGDTAREAWEGMSRMYTPVVHGEGGVLDFAKVAIGRPVMFAFDAGLAVATLGAKAAYAAGLMDRDTYRGGMSWIADTEGFAQEEIAKSAERLLTSDETFFTRLDTLSGWRDMAMTIAMETPRYLAMSSSGTLTGPFMIGLSSAMEKELRLRREIPEGSESLFFWNPLATGIVNSVMYEFITSKILRGKTLFKLEKLFPSTSGGQIAAYAAGAAGGEFVEEFTESEVEYAADAMSGVRPWSEFGKSLKESSIEGGMGFIMSPTSFLLGYGNMHRSANAYAEAFKTASRYEEKIRRGDVLTPQEKLHYQVAHAIAESKGSPLADGAIAAYEYTSGVVTMVEEAKAEAEKRTKSAAEEFMSSTSEEDVNPSGLEEAKARAEEAPETDAQVEARRRLDSSRAMLEYKTFEAMPPDTESLVKEVARVRKLFPRMKCQVDTHVTWESLPAVVRAEAEARGYSRDDLPRYMPVRGGVWINGDKVRSAEVADVLANSGVARSMLSRRYGERAKQAALNIFDGTNESTEMKSIVERAFGEDADLDDAQKVECVAEFLSDRMKDYAGKRPGYLARVRNEIANVFKGDPAFSGHPLSDADLSRLMVSLLSDADWRTGTVVLTESGFAQADLAFVDGLARHLGIQGVEIATEETQESVMADAARDAGMSVEEFQESGYRINGFYRAKDGRVFIFPGADPRSSAFHEFAHYLKKTSPETYERLADVVWSALSDKGGEMLQDTAELYKGMSRDAIVEEFIADRIGEIAATPEFAGEFARYLDRRQAGLGRRFLYALQDFLRKVMEFLHLSGAKEDSLTFRDIAGTASEVARVIAEYDSRGEHVPFSHIESDQATQARQRALGRLAAGNDAVKAVDDSAADTKMSFSQVLTGGGLKFEYGDDGSVTCYHADGRRITKANPVTAEEILSADSPFTRVMDYARGRTISDDDISQIAKLYAEIANKGIQYVGQKKDGQYMLDAIWRWAGASVFKSVKANGDKQYRLSIDLTTICKKTEQLVNNISEWQVKNRRGADAATVMRLYLETGRTGFQTPCPACYVFSHWIRGGMLLESAWRAQNHYQENLRTEEQIAAMTPAERKSYEDWWRKEYGRQRAWATEHASEIKHAREALDTAMNLVDNASMILTDPRASKADRAVATRTVEKLTPVIENAYNVLATSDYAGWIKSTIVASETPQFKNKDGEFVFLQGGVPKMDAMKTDFHFVDPDILFDTTRSGELVGRYPAMARFRVSKGSAGGKAIETYCDNAFGDVISGMSGNKAKTETDINTGLERSPSRYNPFLDGGAKRTRTTKFKSACTWQAKQALRGGMRIFSWSDNMVSMGPDMFMNFVQLQAVGGGVQSYSKQLEGAELISAMGGYNNGSLMAYGGGYVVAKDGAKSKPGWVDGHYLGAPVKLDGVWYQPAYSKLQGINAEGLFGLNRKYDRSGNIIVGMNAKHIEVCLASPDIFFCIPWHASSLRAEFLNMMMGMLGESSDVNAQDHTKVQEDAQFGEKKGDNPSTALTSFWKANRFKADRDGNALPSCMDVMINDDGTVSESQLAYRNLFRRIVTGAASDEDIALARKDVFLNQVVDELKAAADRLAERIGKVDKKDIDKHGLLIMDDDDSKSIYPFMYWDKTSTYYAWDGKKWTGKNTMDRNTDRYLEFCARMGVVPKFCGMDTHGKVVHVAGDATKIVGDYHAFKGYPKLLIDRRMYGLDGRYQDVTPVNAARMTLDMISQEGVGKRWGKDVTRTADRSVSAETVAAVDAMRENAGFRIGDLEQSEALLEKSEKGYKQLKKDVKNGVYEKSISVDSDPETEEGDEDVKFSISRVTQEQDADYMKAVQDGDMETARRMVRESATKSGFEQVAYHGTPVKGFSVFSSSINWVTPDRDYARNYAEGFENPGIYDLYINRKDKPDIGELDEEAISYDNYGNERPSKGLRRIARIIGVSPDELLKIAQDKYADSIWQVTNSEEFANLVKSKGLSGVQASEKGRTTYGIINSADIKSADAVTYDDAGNVIPLSQRFNVENNDIRYSLSQVQPYSGKRMPGNILQRYSDVQVQEIARMLQPALDQASGIDLNGMRAWLSSMGVNVRSDRDMRFFAQLARGFREEDDARVAEARLNSARMSGGKPVTIEQRREVARLVVPMAEKNMTAKEVTDELAKIGITVTEDGAEAYLRNARRLASGKLGERKEALIRSITDIKPDLDATLEQKAEIRRLVAELAPGMKPGALKLYLGRLMKLSEIPVEGNEAHPQGQRRAYAERIIGEMEIDAQRVQRDKTRARMLDLTERWRSNLTKKGILSSELSADTQQTVDRIAEVLRMGEDGANACIMAGTRALVEAEQKGEDSVYAFGRKMSLDELRSDLHILQTFGMPDATLEETAAAEKELSDILEKGHGAWLEETEKKRIQARRDSTSIKRGLTGSPDVSIRPDAVAEDSAISRGWHANMNLDTLMEWVAGRDALDKKSTAFRILDSIRHADNKSRDMEFREDRLLSQELGRIVGSSRIIDMMRFTRALREVVDTGIVRKSYSNLRKDAVDDLSYSRLGERGRNVLTVPVNVARAALAAFDASGNEGSVFKYGNREYPLTRMNAEFIRRQISDFDAKLETDYDLSSDPAENERVNKAINEARKKGEVKLVFPPKDESSENIPLVMSRGQALQAILTWDQPDARAIMMWNGWTQENIDALKEFCGDKVLRLGEWMRQSIQDGRAELDAAAYRRYGAHMPEVKSYYPTRYLKPPRAGNTARPAAGQAKALDTGFLVKRKFHTMDIDTTADALDVFKSAIASQRQFVTMAEPMAYARRVLLAPDVKSAILQRYGKDFLDSLQDRLAFVESGSRTENGDEIAGRLFRAFVPAKLAFNAASGVKQVLSTFAYLNGCTTKQMAAGFHDVFTGAPEYKKFLGIVLNSDYLKDRAKSGWAADVRAALQYSDRANPTASAIGYAMNKAGFWMMAMGDRASAITGGYAVYKATYESEIANGQTEEDARRSAFDAWTRSTDSTQQSARKMDQNLYQSGGAGTWGRYWTMFLSNPIQVMNLEMQRFHEAAVEYQSGKKDAAARRVLKTVAINHLLMPSMMLFVSDMFRHGVVDMWGEQDIEDFLAAWILGPFEGYFLVGKLMSAVLSGMFRTVSGKPVGGSLSSGPEDVVTDLAKNVSELKDGDLSAKDAEALCDIFTTAGAVTGVAIPEAGDAIMDIAVPAGAAARQIPRTVNVVVPDEEKKPEKKRR